MTAHPWQACHRHSGKNQASWGHVKHEKMPVSNTIANSMSPWNPPLWLLHFTVRVSLSLSIGSQMQKPSELSYSWVGFQEILKCHFLLWWVIRNILYILQSLGLSNGGHDDCDPYFCDFHGKPSAESKALTRSSQWSPTWGGISLGKWIIPTIICGKYPLFYMAYYIYIYGISPSKWIIYINIYTVYVVYYIYGLLCGL